jgi:hypothetical protein
MKVISKKHTSSFVILEGDRRVLPELKEIRAFTKELQRKSREQFGTNFKFLATWGAAIGGIMMPIQQYLDSGSFQINDTEKILILIGVGSIIFFESEDKIKKLIKLVEEKGLINVFSQVLQKGEMLRDVFLSFMDSLNITLQTLTNVLGYAFLIPVLPMLLDFAQSGYTEKELRELLLRFAYFTSISISGIALKEVVSKIVKRFKER